MENYLGKDVFKLGFGLMRLPRLEDGKTIDIETTKKMVDIFIEGGGTYFDTAFVYDGSEAAAKEALVDRYPRESYTLASKLCAWMGCSDEESAKQEFYTSLERTGAGYFDYYLLHAMQPGSYKLYEEYHLWDFVRELKEKGLVKHWGFSFHASPEVLDELLTKYPDAEFVQLQLNYADWENQDVKSRECYEVARKHGKPIVVMEPIKGGTLANPPKRVQEVFDAADPNSSYASWAVRYVASLEGILTVLSGMSTVEQVEDNMSYMREFKPLTEEEQKTIIAARTALDDVDSILCTKCRYCTDGCPQEIDIPRIFAAMNKKYIFEDEAGAKRDYGMATNGKSKASDCIQCGQCESACPQHLPIIENLEKIAAELE